MVAVRGARSRAPGKYLCRPVCQPTYSRHPFVWQQQVSASSRLTISGLIDENPKLVWTAYYLGALAKTLMDDADAGMAN